MKYVSKVNNFGLKMKVKSGLEKIFLKFLYAQAISYQMNLPHNNARSSKFSDKNDLLCALRDFYKKFCDLCTYYK